MATPELLKFPTRESRKLFRRLRLRTAGIVPDVKLDKLLIGRDDRTGSPMAVYPAGLDASSVVYSFGVGKDVEWDLEMIDRFGMTIHAFDPSPGSMAWAEAADLPREFVFHPLGIADQDGMLKLYPPRGTATVHFSVVNRWKSQEGEAVEVPVKSLASVCSMLGHDHVDVLKMDVEGAEYALIGSVLDAGIPVHQITLEVHHNFPTMKFSDTCRLVASIRSAGYRIFDVSERGRELSFIHESRL